MPPPLILTIDVGSSSVRTLLFDEHAQQVPDFGDQIPYRINTTPDGGVEIDAGELAQRTAESISGIARQLHEKNLKPAAIAFDTFWHNVLGVDAAGRPTTPIIHLFDTRSAAAAKQLASQIDGRALHSRTGCVLHPSYLPAKLLWLSQALPDKFRATNRWMSFGEYFFLKLFGNPVASTSMVSGSGLWNQNANDYDSSILSILPIEKKQLADPGEMDQPMTALLPEYRSQWPDLDQIPWYPALGDGACNNIGSGCIAPDRFALMVGTSGAMRAVIESDRTMIPDGLWCYRVDRNRFVLGGALSNGGEVFAWMKRTLALDPDKIESEIAAMTPGAHGLTVLPLFAGERSPNWRADARAAIIGMSLNTSPMEILRASLESVALRFRNIYDIMLQVIGTPKEVIGSGGALLHSPAWTQMMADALHNPITPCLEKEATSRGAAMLALERLGAIPHLDALPPALGGPIPSIDANHPIYERELANQRRLYTKLFEEN